MNPNTRLMAMYPDGTSEVADVELKGRQSARYYLFSNEKYHKAEMVVAINLVTGETEVIKNRYGDQGRVERRLGIMR
jgi:hypothetical protein